MSKFCSRSSYESIQTYVNESSCNLLVGVQLTTLLSPCVVTVIRTVSRCNLTKLIRLITSLHQIGLKGDSSVSSFLHLLYSFGN